MTCFQTDDLNFFFQLFTNDEQNTVNFQTMNKLNYKYFVEAGITP